MSSFTLADLPRAAGLLLWCGALLAPAHASPVLQASKLDSWPQVHGDAANSGLSASSASPIDAAGSTAFPAYGSTAAVLSSPVAAYGRLYYGDLDGKLYCLSAATMDLLWSHVPVSFAPDPSIRATPAVAAGRVYSIARDRQLRCFDALTGAPIFTVGLGTAWNLSGPGLGLPGWIDPSPTVHAGVVYVAARDGRVRAFDAATGASLWDVPLDPGEFTVSTPAVLESGGSTFVYVNALSDRNRVVCLDAANGDEVWSEVLVTADGQVPRRGWGSIAVGYVGSSPRLVLGTDPPPTADPAEFYVFCLFALKQHGLPQRAWSFDIGQGTEACFITATPAIHAGWIYLPTGRGLFRLGLANPSAPGWYGVGFPSHHTNAWASAAVAVRPGPTPDGTPYVYYVSNEGSANGLICRRASDGAQMWRWGFPSGMHVSSPAVLGGRVFAGQTNGKMLSIFGSH